MAQKNILIKYTHSTNSMAKGKRKPFTAAQNKEIDKKINRKTHANAEDKVLNVHYTGNPTYTGAVQLLTETDQGYNEHDHVGTDIRPRRLELTIHVGRSGDDAMARLIIFRWRPNTSSGVPAYASILDNQTPVNFYGTSNAPLSFHNYDDRSDYQILYDKTWHVNTNKPTVLHRKRLYGKNVNTKIRYAGSSSTAMMNGIFAMWVTDKSLNAPACSLVSRLYYEDS